MKAIKIITLVVLSALFVSLGYAQDSTRLSIPEPVQRTFTLQFPDAHFEKWEYNSNNQWYHAHFKFEGAQHEVYYTKEGDWIRTEKHIRKLALPQTVIDGLGKTEQAGWKIHKAEEHRTKKHDYVYQVEVKSGQQEVYLYFLPDGKCIDTIIKK